MALCSLDLLTILTYQKYLNLVFHDEYDKGSDE